MVNVPSRGSMSPLRAATIVGLRDRMHPRVGLDTFVVRFESLWDRLCTVREWT